MKNPKKFQTLLFIGALLAVLLGFYLIRDSSWDNNVFDADTANAFDGIEITDSIETHTVNTSEIQEQTAQKEPSEEGNTDYYFRSSKLLEQHYQKHGIEMGFSSAEEYEKAASAVVNDPNALHKTEVEDGDDVYYIEATNEFVIVSTDGYIRTYFNPDKGIDYYNKQ